MLNHPRHICLNHGYASKEEILLWKSVFMYFPSNRNFTSILQKTWSVDDSHLLILPGSDSWKFGPLNPGSLPLQEGPEPHGPGNILPPFLSPVGRAACLWGTSCFVYRIGVGKILLSEDQESVLSGCRTAIDRIQGHRIGGLGVSLGNILLYQSG